jgi:glycosyltransferase involved in cell wall biosynthesis
MQSGTREDRVPIRVLHVAENVKGGIATYLDAVLKYRAAETGPASVSLLLPLRERDQVSVPPGVRVDTYSYDGRGPLSLVRLMCVIWKKVRNANPDIVHFHSSFPGFAGRFPMFFMRNRPACVYCAHGWSFEMDMSRWRQVLYEKVEKLLSFGTDAVVNISMSDQKASLVAGLSKSRCVYIPNGIDFPEKAPGADLVLMGSDRINLLFVGRFDRQKGIDLLMDAMAKLVGKPIHLFVVGEAVLGGVEVVPSTNVEFLSWRSRDRWP